MKAAAYVLLLTICAIECRKIVQINKNANIDFINMESGGGGRPNNPPVGAPVAPVSPQKSEPHKTPVTQPKPSVPVTTIKPVTVAVPITPAPTPAKPLQPSPTQGHSNQMDLKPVPGKPAQAPGVTTPGYGTVKQLVTFYDSKGQASVIRPYSYSQAVKQG